MSSEGRPGTVPTRGRLIWAMVSRDLRQIRRHGLLLIISLSIIIAIVGLVFFGMAKDQFSKSGIPTWTGSVLLTEGDDMYVRISVDSMQGVAPLNVTFTSEVVGIPVPHEYEWHFGDGETANEANTSYTFQDPGEFSCNLRVTDSSGESYESNNIRIVVGDPDGEVIRVVISANRTDGNKPLSVAFTNAVVGGTGPYNYSWDFGDGNISYEPNPTHTFVDKPEGEGYAVVLNISDSSGKSATSNTITISPGEPFSVPFTLLDLIFGFCVLLSLILVPTIFATSYNHEIKKGTVRTLVCYPVGVLEITYAKLIYTFIVGFIVCFLVFFLTMVGIGIPFAELFLVFMTALTLSWLTVGIGSLVSNMLSYARKKIVLRPTAVPWFFVIFSLIFTRLMFRLILALIDSLSGGGMDVENVIDRFSVPIAISPYHWGGSLLSWLLDGPGFPNLAVLLVPAALILLGIWTSKRLRVDIYEKE